MNVSGIVKMHRSRSLPAKFTMNRFLGDKILGLNITCSCRRELAEMGARGEREVLV